MKGLERGRAAFDDSEGFLLGAFECFAVRSPLCNFVCETATCLFCECQWAPNNNTAGSAVLAFRCRASHHLSMQLLLQQPRKLSLGISPQPVSSRRWQTRCFRFAFQYTPALTTRFPSLLLQGVHVCHTPLTAELLVRGACCRLSTVFKQRTLEVC